MPFPATRERPTGWILTSSDHPRKLGLTLELTEDLLEEVSSELCLRSDEKEVSGGKPPPYVYSRPDGGEGKGVAWWWCFQVMFSNLPYVS